MPVLHPELREAETPASKLIEKFGLTKPPINVEGIAVSLGLEVIPYAFDDDISGALIIQKSKSVIGYNPQHSRKRKRFTIAHELAHYLLHNTESESLFIDKDFIAKYRSATNYTPRELKQERQANAFAAELLMPRKILLASLKEDEYKDLPEPELIDELAKLFDVSVPAMTIRLSNLNIL